MYAYYKHSCVSGNIIITINSKLAFESIYSVPGINIRVGVGTRGKGSVVEVGRNEEKEAQRH